jgi:putative permease
MLKIFRSWIDKYFSNEEALLFIIILLAVWFVLVSLGTIIAPMVAAIIIAFLLQGLVDRMKQWGVPHTLAVAIAAAFLVSILAVFILVVLPILWQQFVRLMAELPNMVHRVQHDVFLLIEKYPTLLTPQQLHDLMDISSVQTSHFGQQILNFSQKSLLVVAGIFAYCVLVPILVFLFLKDSQLILNWLGRFLPKHRPMMRRVWREMNQQAANYVRGKVIQILIVMVVSFVLFSVLGLRFATLLAILVGLSVLIPYVGTLVASIPVIMVGLFQWGWHPDFFTLCLSFAVMHAVDGYLLVPFIFSEAVNLHPVAIILAVLVFGGLWGFWGVFFAIPLATLVKAIIHAWPKASQVEPQ